MVVGAGRDDLSAGLETQAVGHHADLLEALRIDTFPGEDGLQLRRRVVAAGRLLADFDRGVW
ncbi:hypothetical protein GCM10027169_02810 [Gordonia jinhuaensis]|uniref:Uncharacterized protein n=1 Tax=Gordonia jinhuaensis TaxID=1517702 RepID=A0A916WRX8_9ACTN|nr:hypothetical protein GCM10011489_16350 [Gordonia jinhuaensis]